MKILQFVQKKLIWSIPASMVLGLIYGALFEATSLKAAILPLTFLMVYPMMVNLNIKKVFSSGGTRVQFATQLINFLVFPALAYLIGMLFFPNQPMALLGLLLIALLPTSGMTISWTGFAKGNMAAAVKMTVIGLLLGAILTPLYLELLVGKQISIPLVQIFTQILIVVFLPMLFGFITQQLLIKKYGQERYQNDLKKLFPPVSTLGVLSIVFVAMALKARSIMADPLIILYYMAPLLVFYVLAYVVSTIIGKSFFKRSDGIALVFGSVMRNLSIALAIAMTAFKDQGSEIALVIALAFIIQVQSAVWYVQLTNKVFGKAEAEPMKKAA
jgi:ACR3 family arsenite efflux pump ArsB